MCASPHNELPNAFSDHPDGWAFYAYDGALRHHSSGAGDKYGKEIKNGATIGVLVDTLKGEISFIIDGENYGVAYKDEIFTRTPVYAAIAMLEIGTVCEFKTLAEKLWIRRKGVLYAKKYCRVVMFSRLPEGIFREIANFL